MKKFKNFTLYRSAKVFWNIRPNYTPYSCKCKH